MSSQAKTTYADVTGKLLPLAVKRLQREQVSFARQQADGGYPGLYSQFDDAHGHKATAVVLGPKGSPYAGGFYFFEMSFPDEYPLKPPILEFRTSDGRVRFHPNLYTNGKVCLSILGTWQGPSWTSACTYASVLLSIESILDNHPIHHEPGYENQLGAVDATYTRMVKYENLNVAICNVLEKFPAKFSHFRKTCETRFLEDYQDHIKACDSFKQSQGADTAPVYHFITEYKPNELKQRLGAIRQKLTGIPASLEKKEPAKAAKKLEPKKATAKKAEKKPEKKAATKSEKKASAKPKKAEPKKETGKGKKRPAPTKSSAVPKKKAKKA